MIELSPILPHCLLVIPPCAGGSSKITMYVAGGSADSTKFLVFRAFSGRIYLHAYIVIQRWPHRCPAFASIDHSGIGKRNIRPVRFWSQAPWQNPQLPCRSTLRVGSSSSPHRRVEQGSGYFCTAATEPAINVFPSMIEASISWLPSLANTDPLPALKRMLFSNDTVAAITASSAEPPFCNNSYPAVKASSRACR